MKRLHTLVEKLNTLIREGKIKEAFETYYAQEVVIQVNGNPPVVGKEQNRTREMIFLHEIENVKSTEIQSVTFGGIEDTVSMTEWAIHFITKEGIDKVVYRVNVQHWKENLIISEKIYFCGDQTFPMT